MAWERRNPLRVGRIVDMPKQVEQTVEWWSLAGQDVTVEQPPTSGQGWPR